MGRRQNSGTHLGLAPKNIVPSLFMRSKRKNFSVQRALQNNYWIAQISLLQSPQELIEYLDLWEKIQSLDRDDITPMRLHGDGQQTGITRPTAHTESNSKGALNP
jgi:hypothetical protein